METIPRFQKWIRTGGQGSRPHSRDEHLSGTEAVGHASLSRSGTIVSLRRLLPEAEILGSDDVAISGCAATRGGSRGQLFAALVGSQHDGHDFIPRPSAAAVPPS